MVSVKETITLAPGFSSAKIISKESNWSLLDSFGVQNKPEGV